MWVAPESQSAGIGSQLVEAVVQWIIDGGTEQVRLWVVEDNLAPRRLYERAGFVETGFKQALPSNPSLSETMLH